MKKLPFTNYITNIPESSFAYRTENIATETEIIENKVKIIYGEPWIKYIRM